MAQYYVGWASGPKALRKRLRQHREGLGARITREFARMGIPFDLVVCFPGTRRDERWVKSWKNARRFIEREGWRDRELRRWRGKIPF